MNKIILNKNQKYYRLKYNYPKCGSFLVVSHYWFEYKATKLQYFIGKCFKIRKKGCLSSARMRTYCYKTLMEAFVFINSPMIGFIYSFVRDEIYKKMSFVFLRKSRKAKMGKLF